MEIKGTSIPIEKYRTSGFKDTKVKEEIEQKPFADGADDKKDFLAVDMDFGLDAIKQDLAETKYDTEEDPKIDAKNFHNSIDDVNVAHFETDDGSSVDVEISTYAGNSIVNTKTGDIK